MIRNKLKLYTNLPSLLYMLNKKVITLRDSKYWNDKNDCASMKIYKSRNSLKTLLAICFTQTNEQYHHWSVFAGGVSGVCITFDKEDLIKCIDNLQGFRCGQVEYKTLEELRKQKPSLKEVPFIKRHGYSDECEFRIVYENKVKTIPFKDVKIPIDCIQSIRLAPSIPTMFLETIKDIIKSIEGCRSLSKTTFRSTLTKSNEWQFLISESK